jgi:hypothetical protein
MSTSEEEEALYELVAEQDADSAKKQWRTNKIRELKFKRITAVIIRPFRLASLVLVGMIIIGIILENHINDSFKIGVGRLAVAWMAVTMLLFGCST